MQNEISSIVFGRSEALAVSMADANGRKRSALKATPTTLRISGIAAHGLPDADTRAWEEADPIYVVFTLETNLETVMDTIRLLAFSPYNLPHAS